MFVLKKMKPVLSDIIRSPAGHGDHNTLENFAAANKNEFTIINSDTSLNENIVCPVSSIPVRNMANKKDMTQSEIKNSYRV